MTVAALLNNMTNATYCSYNHFIQSFYDSDVRGISAGLALILLDALSYCTLVDLDTSGVIFVLFCDSIIKSLHKAALNNSLVFKICFWVPRSNSYP